MEPLLISTLKFEAHTLQGETVLVTGAGGGIGYEAARALLWLGANVIIAEINAASGAQAASSLAAEFDPRRVGFIHTDVGDEASVQNLYRESVRMFGKVDAIINNATLAVLGTVVEVPIEQWDASYRVNLRGPVLLARAFLPDMIQRSHGAFLCVSSTGTAYLGGYETFKAAQVHLANTLDAELEGTGVVAFTIGPGLVPTQTASQAVNQLAPRMGMTVEEFFKLNQGAVLSVEQAGAGFAAAVVLAQQFKGMEISSMQALRAAGDDSLSDDKNTTQLTLPRRKQALVLCRQVFNTLKEQSEDWKKRSLFERQWVIRDFRKTSGMSVDEWLDALHKLTASLENDAPIQVLPLAKLEAYYEHLADLAKGYEKNPAKLEESLRHVYGWRDEVKALENLLAD